MIRLIDADKLCEYALNQIDHSVDPNDIMRFPRVDAIPVIRCKDCNYFKSDLKTHRGFCNCHFMEVFDNDYCSAAERKEE